MFNAVYGRTIASIDRKMEEIKHQYAMLCIYPIREVRSKNYSEVEFTNEETWRGIIACDGARGFKPAKTYIDADIPVDITKEIIIPCTVCAERDGGFVKVYGLNEVNTIDKKLTGSIAEKINRDYRHDYIDMITKECISFIEMTIKHELTNFQKGIVKGIITEQTQMRLI